MSLTPLLQYTDGIEELMALSEQEPQGLNITMENLPTSGALKGLRRLDRQRVIYLRVFATPAGLCFLVLALGSPERQHSADGRGAQVEALGGRIYRKSTRCA